MKKDSKKILKILKYAWQYVFCVFFAFFDCDDSNNEMRNISFIWNDYSAFTIVTVILADMT